MPNKATFQAPNARNFGTAAWRLAARGGATPSDFFPGQLDEVAFFPAALDMNAIQQLYEVGRGLNQNIRIIPPAPRPDLGFTLDVGNAPRVLVNNSVAPSAQAGGSSMRGVKIDVELLQTDDLALIGDGALLQCDSVSGADAHYLALRTDDGDTSYVRRASVPFSSINELVRFAPPPKRIGHVRSVEVGVTWRAESTSGESAIIIPFLWRSGTSCGAPTLVSLAAATTYRETANEWLTNPFEQTAWSGSELVGIATPTADAAVLRTAGLQAGIAIVSGDPAVAFRFTRVRVTTRTINDNPRDYSQARVWRVSVPHGAAAPPVPPADTPPTFTFDTLTGNIDPDTQGPVGLDAGDHYYWARACDGRGRPSRAIGPTMLHVT